MGEPAVGAERPQPARHEAASARDAGQTWRGRCGRRSQDVSRFRLKEPAAHAHGEGAEAEPGGARAAVARLAGSAGGPRPDRDAGSSISTVASRNLTFLARFASHVGIPDLSGEEGRGAGEQGGGAGWPASRGRSTWCWPGIS
jgi:hypothetical protein